MNTLTLSQANALLDAALQAARRAGYRPMSVVVVDEAGHLKAMQREDGASMFRVDIALGKAWAAVGMGADTRVLAERAQGNPNFFQALAVAGQGRFIPQTGALLLRNVQGQLLGAIGASGGTGDEDEAICHAGMEAIGLSPD